MPTTARGLAAAGLRAWPAWWIRAGGGGCGGRRGAEVDAREARGCCGGCGGFYGRGQGVGSREISANAGAKSDKKRRVPTEGAPVEQVQRPGGRDKAVAENGEGSEIREIGKGVGRRKSLAEDVVEKDVVVEPLVDL